MTYNRSKSTWKEFKIKDVGRVITGATPSMKVPGYYGGNTPWVTAVDINNKYISSSQIRLTEEGVRKARIVKKGSVLVTCIASIGLNAIADIDLTTNQQINSIEVNNDFDNEFVYYLIQYHSSNLKRIAGKTAVPILNKSEFENYRVFCPSLAEQKQISNVLRKWDEAITIIDKLILAKKAFKHALMQKLLTGQIRFPGFGKPVSKKGDVPEGWKLSNLFEIADVIVSNVDKKTYVSERAVYLCNYMDVYNNRYVDSGIEFMSASASYEEIRKFQVKKLDILITKDSETPDDIGIPAIIMEDLHNVVCGYHLAIIRSKPNIVNPLYLFMALNNSIVKEQWKKLANGVTRFGLGVGDIENASVFIPESEEQSKISNFLFYIDKELSKLNAAKTKLCKERTGLLSKLFNPDNTIGGINGII